MESKWLKEKDELNRLINIEKVSYEEIGRRYGCSGSNIKKVAKQLGINLPQRRSINPCETFGKGTIRREIHSCINCGKDTFNLEFCSKECKSEYEYKQYIERWKQGLETGMRGKEAISNKIKKYLLEKYNNSCQICGWSEVNKFTNRIPLQVHHLNGDCTDNREENLQLLCPNCHSLTENYGSRNKNSTRDRY